MAQTQLQENQWLQFETRRKKQGFFLLPFLLEGESLEKEEQGKAFSRLDAFLEILRPFLNLRIFILSDGNALANDLIEHYGTDAEVIESNSLNEVLNGDYCDLILLNGLRVASFLENPGKPVLIHFGFLSDFPNSAPVTQDSEFCFSAPALADYFLVSNQESVDFLKNYSEFLGIHGVKSTMIAQATDFKRTEESLLQFLKEPTLHKKSTSLLASIEKRHKEALESTVKDLNAKRESELTWMRNSFTGEVQRLLQELEELKAKATQKPTSSEESKPAESINEDLAAKLQSSQAENENLKVQIQDLQNIKAQESDSNSQSGTSVEELESASKKKIHAQEVYIKDLEQRLSRYENRAIFVIFHWVRGFFQTWFIRLPAVLGLLAYHIGANWYHRYLCSKKV